MLKRQKTRADVRAETPPDQAGAKTGEEILIAELAKLDLLQYAMRKKKTAKDLGITVDELNKIVSKARTRKPGQHDPAHWQVEPWPEPVATGDLLHELIAVYTRYVILPEHAAITMALWDLHAWSIETAYCSPFLMFTSPEMRCGKSTALSLLHWTGPRTILASNISPAALFRYIEAARPTLLIDEGETFLKENEEARGILNSGHTRDTAIVIRLVGDNHDPQPFSTWGAKAIASIGKLAATLRDRAIVIPMIRKRRSDRVEKLRRKKDTETFTTLRQKARRWFKDNVATLEAADPVLPDALNDRAADNWEPLLAIADLAGGDWPIRARSAALKLSGEVEIDIQSIGAQLLAAIQTVLFEFNTDRIWSEKLAGVLGNDADSPWAAYGKSGKPITQRQIADLLRPYGIEPDSVRIGDRTKKGYYLTQFTSVFETYVAYPPPPNPERRNNPTNTGTF